MLKAFCSTSFCTLAIRCNDQSLLRRSRATSFVVATTDFYSVLNVPLTASKAEIKAAYRYRAKQCHPDVNRTPEAEFEFKVLCDAFEVLTNDRLRQLYNTRGIAGLGSKYKEYLEKGHQHAGPSQKGKDIHTTVGLEFLEAALGAQRVLNVAVADMCPDCNGVGTKDDQFTEHCHVCDGSGEVMRKKLNKVGVVFDACPACGGKGYHITHLCPRCGGQGLAFVNKAIKVNIPAGVECGSVLRVRGQGSAGKWGGTAGDVYLALQISSREGLVRRGYDLHSSISVAYVDAILGAGLAVDTIHGADVLPVPAGTQHGAVLRLPRAGLRVTKGGSTVSGDHYFKVYLMLPREVSDQERWLLDELQRLAHTL